MAYKRFVILFVSGSFILFALVGLFNRIVDPFWYFRDIEIKGFNAVKPHFDRFERHVKPDLLIRDQPEAIILGSSYAEIGFDPTDAYFTDNGRLKSMNFSLAGAPWDMVQCAFEFAVAHAPVKRALVGFHPGDLPLADCKKKSSVFEQTGIGDLLFSDSALRASIQTVTEQGLNKPSHTREGMYFYARNDAGVDDRFREFYLRQVSANAQCIKPTDISNMPADLDTGKRLDLQGLKRMIDMAKEHGVELVLFAYPRHAYSLELDRRCGGQDGRWQSMKQIASFIEAESSGYGRVRAWEFYAYNDVTGEPIGTRAKYWQDPEHFNFEVGHMMLADMFGGESDKTGFGRPIISGKMDSEYRNFLRGRADYLSRHPEFQSSLDRLLPRQ